MQIKDKKSKSKGFIKSKLINNNYEQTHNANTKEKNKKNKDFFKTNNNFKNHKNLLDNMSKENSSKKLIEKQIKKNYLI